MKDSDIPEFVKCFGLQSLRTHDETIDAIVKSHLARDDDEALAIMSMLTKNTYMYECVRWASSYDDRQYHIKTIRLEPKTIGAEMPETYYSLHLERHIKGPSIYLDNIFVFG